MFETSGDRSFETSGDRLWYIKSLILTASLLYIATSVCPHITTKVAIGVFYCKCEAGARWRLAVHSKYCRYSYYCRFSYKLQTTQPASPKKPKPAYSYIIDNIFSGEYSYYLWLYQQSTFHSQLLVRLDWPTLSIPMVIQQLYRSIYRLVGGPGPVCGS